MRNVIADYLKLHQMKKILRAHPDEVKVASDGSAIYGLNANDNIVVLHPPAGRNFKKMTDEEINDWIVEALSK